MENPGNDKGKSVVRQDEAVPPPPPLPVVEALATEQVLLASMIHHLMPSQIHIWGGVQEAGSSSAAAGRAAAATEVQLMQPLDHHAVHPALPMPMPPPPPPAMTLAAAASSQQGSSSDDGRLVLVRDTMQRCVAALLTVNIGEANAALAAMSRLSSADGDPAQRVAFAFALALGRRAQELLPGVSWAVHRQVPAPLPPPAVERARLWFIAKIPLLRVAAAAANHAIAAAAAAEAHLHVVDLGGASPRQWLELMRLLAVRPGGPPALRLSVVSEDEDFFARAASLLINDAARLGVPFVFNLVCSHIDRFAAPAIAALGVERGQALVITSTLQVHRLIADITTVHLPQAAHEITKADALLRVLRDLSPKLVLLTEQDADHNGGVLWDRVRDAFDYYASLFEDVDEADDAGALQSPTGRVLVERLLREEVADIVACEGAARRERHEKMERWAWRMDTAGFEPAPVSFNDFMAAGLGDGVMRNHYQAVKGNGYFIICSRMTPMFSVTAWQPMIRAARRQ